MHCNSAIKIGIWNMRGFSSSMPYLRKLCDMNDIVLVSEHWLHSNKMNKFEEVSNDILFCGRSSRVATDESYGLRRGQGGVAVLWKRTLGGVSEIKDVIHDRFCGIRLQTEKGAIVNIISTYLPSQSSTEDYDACVDDLSEFIESREAGSINLVGGDFNGDLGTLGKGRSKRRPSKQGRVLAGFVNKFNLFATNLDNRCIGPLDTHVGPTGSSTIDYLMVPEGLRGMVKQCAVLEGDGLNCSDHRPISVNIDLGALLNSTVESTPSVTLRWDKWDEKEIREGYAEPLGNSLDEVIEMLQSNINTCDDIDDAIELLVKKVHIAATAVPKSKFRRNLKPYWNKKLSSLKRIKVLKYNLWKAEGRPRGLESASFKLHKEAKKAFSKELRRLAKQYEEAEVLEAVNSATVNKGYFWNLLKKSRKNGGSRVIAIRDGQEKAVYDTKEVVEVWRTHFSKLCVPSNDPEFDNEHFDRVNEHVNALNNGNEEGPFLLEPFNIDEVKKAVYKLKLHKACGYDKVSSEHMRYAGEKFFFVLTLLYNIIVRYEYVPTNLRRGIQIPLYKGKNLDSLDVNSYRGITLLTNLNKVYEMLLWGKMEKWWTENEVISRFQGAGKKGSSCVHTAMMMEETVSTALETNRSVLVSYFDVSKAFDTVWTNGLFHKLHEMGVRGRMWRLLYRAYQDFRCCVRVEGEVSDWYTMQCGIHQGGFLSLTKYTAFINELLVLLEQSKLCCEIYGIPSSPGGYADDLATATTSKARTDKVHNIVVEYGRRWRFRFNAKKSAVLVHGETKFEHGKNSPHRVFRLGADRVPEKSRYDHVGVKACIFENDEEKICEKISKGRRTLNATTGLGIRKNGLSMSVCNIIFWAVVVPIITFGCETWVLCDRDRENLLAFQRFAGRRVQRLSYRSPNASSFFGLGWSRLTTYIDVKKLLFVLTIIKMDSEHFFRAIFDKRLKCYLADRNKGLVNAYKSPLFDIFSVCAKYDLLDAVTKMSIGNSQMFSKAEWSKLCWERAWDSEDSYWRTSAMFHKDNDLMMKVLPETRYLSWWHMADINQGFMRVSENLVKIICRASKLKCDDPSLKGALASNKTCERCDLYAREDMFHILMQCPYFCDERTEMYEKIYLNQPKVKEIFEDDPPSVFSWLLGK